MKGSARSCPPGLPGIDGKKVIYSACEAFARPSVLHGCSLSAACVIFMEIREDQVPSESFEIDTHQELINSDA
jgi:hypothetical protein